MTSTPPTTVVFLHGVGQMPMAWHDLVLALPTGWRALTPWVPGLKPTDARGFALDRAVDELLTWCDTQGLTRAHFVGLSLGAVVALRLAARHPEYVDRLVLCAGQVSPPKALLKAQKLALRLVPERKLREQGLSRARLASVFDELAGLDLHGDLARVESATLVVVGERDKPNQPAAKLLAAGIRDAQRVRVPGGHELNTESPQELSSVVYEFLDTGPSAESGPQPTSG